MPRKVRGKSILFLSADKFPPFRVDVAVLFGKKLARWGYRIDWLLQSEAACPHFYRTTWNNGRVWVAATDNGISRWRRLKKHFYKTVNELRIFALAKGNGYDIIQVKDDFPSAILAILAARKNHCKFVYWLSYPFPEANIYEAKTGVARYPLLYFIRGHLFRFLLYRAILPAADLVFVQSEQMKKDVAARGIALNKLIPVPMGVEIEKIPYQKNDAPRIAGRPPGEKRVLYLGTLIKVRKLDFLVRAFAALLAKQSDAILYLVGAGEDPSDEQFLLDEAERLGIGHALVMTGFLPMEEAWEHVRKSTVCVSPFYPTFILNSTSPTKLIEYMAMGKAVVATDHPEQRLVIEQSGGGLCVAYDEEAFASAIDILLRDPRRAAEMGERGRAYVKRYRSYDAIAELVDREYERMALVSK